MRQEGLIHDVHAVTARLVEANRILDQTRDVLDLRLGKRRSVVLPSSPT
jgi:hypothetical protein